MESKSENKGYKVGTTAIIWAFATAMLGICVPLTAITRSGAILPLAVIIGAGGGTVAVWRDSSRSHLNKISELETRIIDLETISSSLEMAQEETFKKLESEQKK